MEGIDLPPFYIGQKVICVDCNGGGIGYKMPVDKDRVYTVRDITKFCCGWVIYVGLGETISNRQVCRDCGKHYSKPSLIWWLSAKRFIPIEETFQSITLEKILEEETPLVSAN